MEYITYMEIVSRNGKRQALKFLRLIERLARIEYEIESIDLEKRFQRALRALSDINFAA